MVHRWLDWAKMKAKVPKCRALFIQASTGRTSTSDLTIGGQCIPPVEEDDFKFLEMPVRVLRCNDGAREFLKGDLQQMLASIDETPLTSRQKLRLFR